MDPKTTQTTEPVVVPAVENATPATAPAVTTEPTAVPVAITEPAAAPQPAAGTQEPAAAGKEDLVGGDGTQAAATENKTTDGAQPGGEEVQSADLSKLSIPEGFKLDGEKAAKFEAYIKDNKLGQEQAQALVDMHTETVKTVLDTGKQVKEQWRAEAAEHFKGKDMTIISADVNKALDGVGVEGFKEFMQDLGATEHKAFIEVFSKLGREVFGTHKFVSGGAGASGRPRTLADIFKPKE
ncbi:hypothetical protein AAIR98_001438 [Elusimicrobium simillimum]|uniref:hypothetical protein n=1 Tax=Elusimicrobium simillimum TaxID=3143438 RepID=UPI003C6FA76C